MADEKNVAVPSAAGFGTVTLNDGYKLPAIAFGSGSVWKYTDVTALVSQAIEEGFSHLDTAQAYRNEDSVGKAIKDSGLARSELYVTTKYLRGDIEEGLHASLQKLGLEYVDLYLIHQPWAVDGKFEEPWKTFEKLQSEGLAKSIGVSNFSKDQLQLLIKTAHVIPAVNQIEFHPYNYLKHKPLLEYAAKRGIIIEAYGSLAPLKTPGGAVDEPIKRAAKRIGATPTQVILSWVRAKGVVIVTTSANKAHLREYLAVADLPPLTPEEIAAIDEAGAKGPPSDSLIRLRTQVAALAASPMASILVLLALGAWFTLNVARGYW
ncbi:hypothetical protein PLICRDRAFT_43309 [Plicaturopsis crispa FD-325 SS-3]|nr:hypothetical protein PLICRDRAFT_43309 [Plicaturopsis crispa FD-325 SS-3]